MVVIFALAPKTPEFFSETVVLGDGRQVVGRSATCNIVIGDNTISRKHAEILLERDKVKLRDLRSLNGTFVNEKRVGTCEINLGDQLRFGRVAFLVISESSKVDFPEDEGSTAPCNPPGK